MQRSFLLVGVSVVFAIGLVGCSGGGGGGSAGVVSDPAAGVYAGVVQDQDGKPVVGAQVSVEGIEASAVTGADGSFVVSDASLAVASAHAGAGVAFGSSPLEISVLIPGYAAHVSTLNASKGSVVAIQLVRNLLEPRATVTSPTGQKLFVIPENCSDPRVLVEGFVNLGTRDNHLLDVIVVVDRSGSTSKLAFDVDGDEVDDSVLDAEIAAVRCFLGSLDVDRTRISVLQFNDSADVVADFGRDRDALLDALDGVGGADGGTNYEAALLACRDRFVALGAADAQDFVDNGGGEEDIESMSTPERLVVFLTDGVPTSHGVPRNQADSNLTQSFEDRRRSIEAAATLAEETGAKLVAFSIISSEDTNRTRTTLPHCVSACGGGKHVNVLDVEQLSATLCGDSLDSVLAVKIRNTTIGSDYVSADLAPGGFFSQQVPVAFVGTASPDGTVENTIEVVATAFSGVLERAVTVTTTVRVVDRPTFVAYDHTDTTTAQSAPQPVSSGAYLDNPNGERIRNNRLYNFLVGQSTGEFEDAVELYGVDTFTVYDSTGQGAKNVTLTIDFVFNEACYRSDFGYIVVDPEAPPESAWEALRYLPAAQVLFNSGPLIAQHGCSVGSIPPGSQTFQVDVPTGSVVAFFILPNRTLSQYKASPWRGKAPLFTMPNLNPGKFDQCLTFRSVAGRTETGASLDVVTPGSLVVFAFEDIQIAGRRSDQDFDDVVFTVRSDIVGRIDGLECD